MELNERVNAAVPSAGATLERAVHGEVLVVEPATVVDVLRHLRDDPEERYDMLVDITAVDMRPRGGGFEVVYLLRSLARNCRATVKVRLPGDDPVVATSAGLWRNANWAEREVWDMFGVHFQGHPDLRRLLMYESFEGHPLRKDYPVDKRQPLVPERDPIRQPWPSRDGL